MTFSLQIDQLLHADPHEDVVAPSPALLETEPPQETAEVIELDVRVGTASQQLSEELVVFRHRPKSYQPPGLGAPGRRCQDLAQRTLCRTVWP